MKYKYPSIKASFRAFTPIRYSIAKEWFHDVIMFFFGIGVLILLYNNGVNILRPEGFYPLNLPISENDIFVYQVVVLVGFIFEICTHYQISRSLFGKTLISEFTEDHIKIRTGVRISSITIDRSRNPVFRVKDFKTCQSQIYRHSKKLQVVYDDGETITLAEVFDLRVCDQIVTKLNRALIKSFRNNEFDFDPRIQDRRRYES